MPTTKRVAPTTKAPSTSGVSVPTAPAPIPAPPADLPNVPLGTSDHERTDRIRDAAYRKFTERGSMEGNAEQDWLEAEAEVDAASSSRP